MPEWIDNLKVGDDVICGDYIQKVTAVHKRHILVGTSKYRKSNGYYVTTARWSSIPGIEQATPEHIELIKAKAKRGIAIRRLRELRPEKCSTAAILKIIEIIEEDMKCQNG